MAVLGSVRIENSWNFSKTNSGVSTTIKRAAKWSALRKPRADSNQLDSKPCKWWKGHLRKQFSPNKPRKVKHRNKRLNRRPRKRLQSANCRECCLNRPQVRPELPNKVGNAVDAGLVMF